MTEAEDVNCGYCWRIVPQPGPEHGLKLYCTKGHAGKARERRNKQKAGPLAERACAVCRAPHRYRALFGVLDLCRACRQAAYGTCWRKERQDAYPYRAAGGYRCELCDRWHLTLQSDPLPPLLEYRLAGLRRLIRSTGFDIAAFTQAEIKTACHIYETPVQQHAA